METVTDDATPAVTQVEEIFAKDTWTQQDCEQLYVLLFEMSRGTEKFRTLAGRFLAGNADPTGTTAVKAGIALYMLGNFEEALRALGAGTDNRDRRWYQGLCCRRLSQYDKAIEEFIRAGDRGWDESEVRLAAAECQLLSGDTDAAEKAVGSLAKLTDVSEYHVLRGMVLQNRGQYEQAEEAFGEALDLDPNTPSAAFRLAFLYDMHGEEDQAIELYEQCLQHPPVDTNALINLAVLYEDNSDWAKAANCLDTVLSVQPNHPRARLYSKDVASSRSMYYDEDLERRTVQRNAVLDIPVTDFELSVRARNCLKKMEIYTLGDLLHVSEADLLGSKNFGETSLVEIKTMLAQKGLSLGQDAEPQLPITVADHQSQTVSVGDESVLATPVAELALSVRARKALERLGIATLGDLAGQTESDLLTCKNFGHTSLSEVRLRLSEFGLDLQSR